MIKMINNKFMSFITVIIEIASNSFSCSSSGQLEWEEAPNIPTIKEVFVTNSLTTFVMIEFPDASASFTWNSPDKRSIIMMLDKLGKLTEY